MIYFLILVSFFLSIVLSSFIIPRILLITYKKKLFDQPDERKLHQEAVPRLGGVSFVPSLFVSVSFVVALRYLLGHEVSDTYIGYIVPEFCLLICGLTLLYLTGVKDDLLGLRYRTKFAVQFISASLFPLSGLWINNLYGLFGIYELAPFIGIPFTILLVVFITNAINLIDGIDGLASGLSIAALSVFGFLFMHLDLWLYSILAFSMLGVLIPFFYYNVFGKVERHQKIFMGDTGSLTLGYILAFLAIRYASQNSDYAPYSEGAIVIAFATLIVPMFDVIRVMLVRLRLKKPIFEADRNHIHHKFLDMGFSPRKAMILIIALSCSFSIVNIVLVPYVDNNILFFGDIIVWIALNLCFDWIRDRRKKGLVVG